MKNRWKHILIPVLAMALCLSLAACGNSDDVAGEDWRTTGVVVGSGTITHDSESVDVLVTADPNSAAFYRDQEEQVLFDSVAFPETIEDISSSAFQISFDDQNGDEESDVLVEIGHEDMSNTTMLWLWDPQERYVYQPDYSSFHVPGVAGPEELIAPYVGLWEYQGENLWLRIREDATWEFVNDQDDVIEYGTLWVDENGVTLHFDGSGDTLQLDRTVSGDLIDSVNGGTLLPVEGIQSSEPYFTRNGLEINAAVERGTFLLEDGVCSYSGLGDGYNTDDCYWEITKNGDYTHDGIRELHFDLRQRRSQRVLLGFRLGLLGGRCNVVVLIFCHSLLLLLSFGPAEGGLSFAFLLSITQNQNITTRSCLFFPIYFGRRAVTQRSLPPKSWMQRISVQPFSASRAVTASRCCQPISSTSAPPGHSAFL